MPIFRLFLLLDAIRNIINTHFIINKISPKYRNRGIHHKIFIFLFHKSRSRWRMYNGNTAPRIQEHHNY